MKKPSAKTLTRLLAECEELASLLRETLTLPTSLSPARRRGRPALPPGKKKKKVQVYLRPETRGWLDKLAITKKDGPSASVEAIVEGARRRDEAGEG